MNQTTETTIKILHRGQKDVACQSGRTMLEMLGVLAIMGIITYGAIAGINYGMTSYKINQTYNEVQDIIQGVQDLYSWTKIYHTGNASDGKYAGCSKIIAAACTNDVLQSCNDSHHASSPCTGRGAFGRINIQVTGDGNNFQVIVPIEDPDNRTRVADMDWAAVNITCDCDNATYPDACVFSPE